MAAEISEFTEVLEDNFEELSQKEELKTEWTMGEKTWNSERLCLDRQDRKAGELTPDKYKMCRTQAVRSHCPLVMDALGARRFVPHRCGSPLGSCP